MHQNTPEFVWYIAKVVDDERWYLVRVDDRGGRYWSKKAAKGKYWFGLPAAQAYADRNFTDGEVTIGGKARII